MLPYVRIAATRNTDQPLCALGADGDDKACAVVELRQQLLGNLHGRRGRDDPLKRRLRFPTVPAIAKPQRDVADRQFP